MPTAIDAHTVFSFESHKMLSIQLSTYQLLVMNQFLRGTLLSYFPFIATGGKRI